MTETEQEKVERVARALEIAAVEQTGHHPVSNMWGQLVPWLFPHLARAAIAAMETDDD